MKERLFLLMIFLSCLIFTIPSTLAAANQQSKQDDQALVNVFDVYTDLNFGGGHCWSTAAESNNIHTSCNDQISSLKILNGWAVRVYRDPNLTGSSRCFIENDPILTDNIYQDGSTLNDSISSFVVVNSPICSPINPLEVFNDPNFQGQTCFSANAERANFHAACDNAISSINLRPGWSIWLFRDANQAGPRVCLNAADIFLNDNLFSDGSVVNDSASSFTLYQQPSCGGATPVPTPPPPSTEMPFFSQLDPAWRYANLGGCSAPCNKIGACGCTLTSAAMIFKHYGANTNPAELSQCMGNRACPFYWGVGANCSLGTARNPQKYGFSWSRLQQSVAVGPVILGMKRNGNTHWVVVYKGSGVTPANYTINDPGYLGGDADLLSWNYANWTYEWVVTYQRSTMLIHKPLFEPARLLNKPEVTPTPSTKLVQPMPNPLTGAVEIYERTDTTMTIALSIAGDSMMNVEMVVWVDGMPNDQWQPFSDYVSLPKADTVYAQFRNSKGLSPVVQSTIVPIVEIPEPQFSVVLPFVILAQ